MKKFYIYIYILLIIPLCIYNFNLYNIFFNSQKIVIANLNGSNNLDGAGLGNQLFTFSFAYSYAKKIGTNNIVIKNIANCNNDEDFMDLSKRCYALHKFGINLPIIYNMDIFNKYKEQITTIGQLEQLRHSYRLSSIFLITPIFDSNMPNLFKEYNEEIKKLFVYQAPLSQKTKYFLEQIKNTQSIAIHVRRGDFVDRNWNFPLSYHIKAAYLMASMVADPKIFIFSDDHEYVKEYFNNKENIKLAISLKNANQENINNLHTMFSNAIYVSQIVNHSLEEFFLMTQCKHNIIPNSTFSWWAAFLNKNPNKIVIAPLSAPEEQYNPKPPDGEKWIQINP